jgi:hypothetical protein
VCLLFSSSFNPDSLIPTVQFVSIASEANLEQVGENAGSESQDTRGGGITQRESVDLANVIDFSDFVQPFKNGQISIPAVLGSIIDLLPEGEHREAKESAQYDHGSLYPAIDAALNWILASRFVFVPSAMAASQEMKENSSIGNSLASMGTLLSLFLTGGSTEVLAPSIETLYTGVVLHAFYDKFEAATVSLARPTNSKEMFSILQQKMTDLGITLNLWSVCSYDGQETLGHLWKPVVQATGGNFYRFTLRINPEDEKWRLKEELRRFFAKRLATKCLIKLRVTPSLNVIDKSVAGCVTTFDQESDMFQANAMDEDTSVSMRFLVDDSFRSAGWNSLDQKLPSTPASNKKNNRSDERGHGLEAVVIQVVVSYETVEAVPFVTLEKPDKIVNEGNVPPTFCEGEEFSDPWQFFQNAMSIWGHEWKCGVQKLLFPKENDTTSIRNEEYFSDDDLEKISILRKMFAKYRPNLINNGKSLASSSTTLNRNRSHKNIFQKSFPLRRESAFPAQRSLCTRKYVRVINLCLDCTENITQLRDSCNLSVALSIFLREALHRVGGYNTVSPLLASIPPRVSTPTDNLMERINQNIGGEKELFNSIVHILQRAAKLKEIELRKLYQKRNSGGHYTVDIVSLHKHIMVEESYSRDVIHSIYRVMARILSHIDSDPLRFHSRELIIPRVRDELIEWMFRILRSSPSVLIQLVIPNLRGVKLPKSGSSKKAFVSSDDIPVISPSTTISDTNVERIKETRPALSQGLTVQFDDTGLLSSDVPEVSSIGQQAPMTVSRDNKAANDDKISSTCEIGSEKDSPFSMGDNEHCVKMLLEPIPLRRNAMMSADCNAFLLDSGTELILYKPLTFGEQWLGSDRTSGDDHIFERSIFPFLAFRLMDHPVLPRLVIAEAGELSAHTFSSHLLEDTTSEANSLSFMECKELTLQILESTSFD